MTNEHNIGWGFTARQKLRFERIGTGLAFCRFPGLHTHRKLPLISFTPHRDFSMGWFFLSSIPLRAIVQMAWHWRQAPSHVEYCIDSSIPTVTVVDLKIYKTFDCDVVDGWS